MKGLGFKVKGFTDLFAVSLISLGFRVEGGGIWDSGSRV